MGISMANWIKLSDKPGPYRVTRWCCSGNCIKCNAAHDLTRRVRVVQMDKLNKEAAEYVASQWKSSSAVLDVRIERGGK